MQIKTVSVRAIFSGYVQGVGFRYTADHYASKLNVSGTVKNLADGTVELYAQGTQESVDTLINSLKNHFGQYVHHVDVQPLETQKTFSRFQII